MRPYLYITLCISGLFFIHSVELKAQDSINVNNKLTGAYIISYFTDEYKVLESPLRWNQKQWISAGGVLCSAALLYTQDKNIKGFFQKNKSPFFNNATKYVFEPFGRGLYSLPLLGVLYITSKFTKSSKLERTALESVKAFAISGVTVELLKEIIHRPRPYQYDQGDMQLFDGPFGESNYNSMPSGHSISAFSVATVIATEYKNTIWVPILAYSIASGVAISRIYDNKHWASDVLMGASLGWAIGKFICNNKKLSVFPISNNYYQGLGCRLAL